MTQTDESAPKKLRLSVRPQVLPDSGWSAPLTTVLTAAMAFLGVLTLAAGMAALLLAAEWRADLTGAATVRIATAPEGAMGARVEAVTEVLRTTPGIAGVRALDDEEQAALIAPWLGEGLDLSDLPAPRLIDVTLEGAGPDASALQQRLDLTVEGAVYDDHAAWREPLAASAEALTRLALVATALVLGTAGVTIAFAARATLAANAGVIEVVRLVGAEDRFITAAFVSRLARRAAIGGFLGAGLGCAALAFLPEVETDAALGIDLRPHGWTWLLPALGLPLAATAVAWAAARVTVGLALSRMR